MIKLTNLVDWDFISAREGGRRLLAYVPHFDGKGIESGVTVATGCDLGQRNEDDIRGLDDSLIAKLKPYIGVTGSDAAALLSRLPLAITVDEAIAIDTLTHREAIINLMHDWANAKACIRLECLDKKLRTVVASVAFQYGDLPTRTPNFWKQVTTGDWTAAYYNLMDFKDAYPSRRRLEAKLVSEVIYGV